MLGLRGSLTFLSQVLNLGLNDTTAEARKSLNDSTPRLSGFIGDSASDLFLERSGNMMSIKGLVPQQAFLKS